MGTNTGKAVTISGETLSVGAWKHVKTWQHEREIGDAVIVLTENPKAKRDSPKRFSGEVRLGSDVHDLSHRLEEAQTLKGARRSLTNGGFLHLGVVEFRGKDTRMRSVIERREQAASGTTVLKERSRPVTLGGTVSARIEIEDWNTARMTVEQKFEVLRKLKKRLEQGGAKVKVEVTHEVTGQLN